MMTSDLTDRVVSRGVVGVDAPTEPSAVDAAVRFVAMQPGGARRILVEHVQRPDGTCGGCLTSPVPWPCVVSVIATRALEIDPA